MFEKPATVGAQHLELLETIETDYHRFSLLDEHLHRLINRASSNRFLTASSPNSITPSR